MLLLFLLSFWLIPFCVTQSAPPVTPTRAPISVPSQKQGSFSSVKPTFSPTSGGTKILIYGSGFSSAPYTYYCNFQGPLVSVVYVSSTVMYCLAPSVTNLARNFTLQVVNISGIILFSTPFQYLLPDSCFQGMSHCGVWGDPHINPFCGDQDKLNSFFAQSIQNSIVNLVTSIDGRFWVHGKTNSNTWQPYLNTFEYVCNLYALSITGPDINENPVNIIFDSTIQGQVVVKLNGVTTKVPYIYNGVNITAYVNNFITVTFPGGEQVIWDGRLNADIYLPGKNYWKNVVGICGPIDSTVKYCTGSNNFAYGYTPLTVTGITQTINSIDPCAATYILPEKWDFRKRAIESIPANGTIPASQPIPASQTTPASHPVPASQTIPGGQPIPGSQPVPASQTIPGSQPIPDSQPAPEPEEFNYTAKSFVLQSNFVTNAAISICGEMFEILGNICPANYSGSLTSHSIACAYDGSALITIRLNQLTPISSSSLSGFLQDVKKFFSNLGLLGETVLDPDTYTVMVSSVKAGIHDCYYQNLFLNATNPNFDAQAFHNSLPGCESYCKIPGSSCSADGNCQFSLTLEQLINWNGSSNLHINVLFFIVCVVLSIWQNQ